MDASMRFDTQRIGALPVITEYLGRLELVEIVDRLVPWEGEVPLGMLVEVLVMNRLLQPTAMFRVGEWAEQAAVDSLLEVTKEQLNDDRLGRAFERVAEYGAEIQAALTIHAIKRFRLQVSQIHYDVTDVELFGAYEGYTAPDAPSPQPTYGRTKSGRHGVKQIQCGLSVTKDGGVPLTLLPLDGNTAEAQTHLENLRQLRDVLQRSDFVYIADTKLDVQDNLLAIHAGGGKFLCGGALAPQWQEEYLRLRKKLRRIDYYSPRQAHLPVAERDEFRGYETTYQIAGTVDNRPVRLKYRVIFIWSEDKARQQATTRERHVAKITADLEQIQKNLNKFSLKTQDTIVRRVEQAKARYSEGKLFDYKLTCRAGKFSLSWKLNAQELQRRVHLEGLYLLKTNLSQNSCPLGAVLEKYKQQNTVERRFSYLKGPLAVAPMFLKNPQRMAGLLYILVWALMIMSLMERQIRKSLKGKPLYGLYPENRPSAAPTGVALLNCFSTLCFVIVKHKGTITKRLADLTTTQRELIRLLGIPPNALATFKRGCGM